MITKKRLEELIEQGATIYEVVYRYKSNNIEEYDLKDIPTYSKNHLDHFLDMHEVFETKEDAEFACKYQNISIFYSLNLPTYEDFVKNYQSFGDELITDEKCVIFSCKDGLYSLYACDNEIWVGKDSDGSVMFHKELNKENYIRACDICVKLFKGEEV